MEWFRDCTGFKGRCGNTYIREEELSQQFEEVVRRIQIPGEIADAIAETLRTSQGDKERFHRTAVMQLQQRYLSVQNKLDRAYDDRLGGNITDELWTRKSQEWQRELEEIRRETSRHEKASADYSVTGSKILELAKNAHNLFIQQDPAQQARLLKILLSNCSFDRGSLCPTYTKPFDLFVAGNETGDWRREWDSDSCPSFGFCKLQVPHCRQCQECRRCRGALPAIARQQSLAAVGARK